MSTPDDLVDEQQADARITGDEEASPPSPPASGRHLDPAAGASPAAGRTPVAAPAAGLVGVLVALIFLGLAVVGIRDALTAAGAFSGQLWTARAADAFDGLARADWMIPAGVVAILIGLWWVLAALKPRRRTGLNLGESGLVWTRPRDVARLAAATAEDVDGVTDASSSASRRTVTVRVQTTVTDTRAFEERIAATVAERLSALEPMPKIKVNARTTGDSR